MLSARTVPHRVEPPATRARHCGCEAVGKYLPGGRLRFALPNDRSGINGEFRVGRGWPSVRGMADEDQTKFDEACLARCAGCRAAAEAVRFSCQLFAAARKSSMSDAGRI
ncbi:hypothetical protein [Burkholderia singularis]|uniref:hypothetical protein n=1 Tax=Burkholderia singularis TaxID=1503053 RepID=UPI00211479D3|nr:hypothetical protein [Burkholderia singularis]